MNNQVLVVYNICGINGRVNAPYYVNALNSILNQKNINGRVILSSCLNSHNDINPIYNILKNQISYNIILEKLPVNVTFNDSVLKCVKQFGEFESYLYVDSGCFFNNENQISLLYNLLDDQTGMVSARTNTDTGFTWLYNTKDEIGDELFLDGDFSVPLGNTFNAHVILYSNKILQYYERLWADIFAGQCSESTFTFVCSALKLKCLISKDVILPHIVGLDGPSSGFVPAIHKQQTNKPNWDHLFITRENILDIINRGKEYGMGYEEFQQIVMHDQSKFDEKGFALDDRLKSYIKENLFLQKSQFDYNTIKGQFIA